jgi:hypothetical protein
MIEVYPPPENSEIIRYIFWDMPTALTITSTLPLQIDPYIFKEGMLIDAYRYMKAKAILAGNLEAAAMYRNDEMTSMTKWEKFIQQAIKADRGVDDISLILQTARRGAWRGQGGDYRTAHDIVFDRAWENI